MDALCKRRFENGAKYGNWTQYATSQLTLINLDDSKPKRSQHASIQAERSGEENSHGPPEVACIVTITCFRPGSGAFKIKMQGRL
ncbi:hypothetical protein PoB_001326500 [Plakobranchus ocellatus]|uniref:Uncharacterized protein n=1 Tax=Plakobranchus ocellatus TaxID=259542 RepID=A0AAV3YV93_9GAST|nr:hypothetical protein PoB_001326500 [Plakobranchus ocellatus]